MEKYADDVTTMEECLANKENGTLWGIFMGVLGDFGFGYNYWITQYNETYFTAPSPVSSTMVINAQLYMLGIIIYVLLAVSIYTGFYSVENKYQIGKEKVSDWYDDITQKPSKKKGVE
jgi:hypothetical protein